VSPTNNGAPLRPGEIVRVRSESEILASLDAEGRCDRLPFMPEMLPYCGRTLRVYKRADKTCDSIWAPGMLRMRDAVFLWGARCDGSAHGGCQSGCQFFWKEAWLDRVTTEPTSTGPTSMSPANPAPTGCTVEALTRATRGSAHLDAEVYACQATQLRAAAEPLPRRRWWDVRQYAEDVRSGNAGLGRVIAMLARRLRTSVRYRSGRLLERMPPQRRPQHVPAPAASGRIQAGDRVRVRSRKEIEATLDATGTNRGLSFYLEMQHYCGHEFRVLRRVERIVHEKTGELIHLRDCLVLDDVICQGDYHGLCPRALYPFWREAWLRKLD
jgi:hypothetical protein